ncbi:hypothetical protein HYU50_01825 [Candidatus Woesearchaeota archaeon]|nr:hypothetical protein [Candidatus Woesearchaeota archaeon]
MKKLLFLMVFILALYSVSVSAAASVGTINDIYLGTTALGTTKESSFTLTNNGDVNLSAIAFTFSKTGFNLGFNKTNFSLSSGASEDINFTITIPALTSTGNVTLGSVNLVSTELNQSPLFSIRADVVGGLIIEDLDVFLTTRPKYQTDGTIRSDNEADTEVNDGSKLDFGPADAGPGSELRFNFNIENTFEDSDDIDIRDATVLVTIEGIDDGEDIDEESEEFDVNSGQSTEADIFISIPLSVADGTYDIAIEVEGDDTNGNTHTATMNLEMAVKKEGRDIIVAEASLFPEKVICGGASTLTATIKNLGTRIEEDTGIGIANSDLGVNYLQKRIELSEEPFDEDNEFTKSITIATDKSTTKSGTYPIIIRSYIQDDVLWETKTVNLAVEQCSDGAAAEAPAGEAVEETNETETVEAVTEETQAATEETQEETTGSIAESVQVPVLKPETTTEIPLTKRAGFWAAVVLANIIVIGGIAYLAVKLYGKKL